MLDLEFMRRTGEPLPTDDFGNPTVDQYRGWEVYCHDSKLIPAISYGGRLIPLQRGRSGRFSLPYHLLDKSVVNLLVDRPVF
jgi:hypothetical protein